MIPPPPPEAPPPCPSCGVPTRAIRDDVVGFGATSPTSLREAIVVECMTTTCPDFGRRWKVAELEAILAGAEVENSRPSWDDQFLDIARITARRATCDRSQVGCVLVVDNRIVSSGYNGSFPGAAHCSEVGHHMVNGRCVRTVHAEANAIADAARRGVSVEGGTAYLTRLPCETCLKLLIASGIKRIVCAEVLKPKYIEPAEWFANEGGVELVYPDPE